MKEFLIVSILVSTLFLSEGLIYGSTFLEKEVDLYNATSISLDKESYKDLYYVGEKASLTNEEKKVIENYALKYRERAIFLDLGANIDGFKEIGKERYYQITLYSKSVKGNDLTGVVDRVLINKKIWRKFHSESTSYLFLGISMKIQKLTNVYLKCICNIKQRIQRNGSNDVRGFDGSRMLS